MTSSKKLPPLLHYSLLAFIYAVALSTLFIHTIGHAIEQHSSNALISTDKQYIDSCQSIGSTKNLTIVSSNLQPTELKVNHCDVVNIINKSSGYYDMAIGTNLGLVHYPGFKDKVLGPNQSYSFVAYEKGTFPIHDHLSETAKGTITVN